MSTIPARLTLDPNRYLSLLPGYLTDHLKGRRYGKVIAVLASEITVAGITLSIGQICQILANGGSPDRQGEVISITREGAILTVLGSVEGLNTGALVYPVAQGHRIRVGPWLTGRVLDGLGNLIDNKPPPSEAASEWRPTAADPPAPLSRPVIREYITTGVRAIDGLLTTGKGQRIGIFAPAGVGKSTLLGMIARGMSGQICVIALTGERGREVREFIDAILTPGQRERTVIVVATSDRPAIERMKAAYTATTIAEYFRDQGHDVLLLCDSLTRFARALRETGLAAGEVPVRRGYPPSVFASLPRLLERAGPAERGSITAFYTVLLEDADTADPIGEEVRSLLDGHITLSPEMAAAGHYPAIDIGQSVSRLMSAIVDKSWRRDAQTVRSWLSKYKDAEMLLQIGEYESGNDPLLDCAVTAMPDIRQFFMQAEEEISSSDDTREGLDVLIRRHTSYPWLD